MANHPDPKRVSAALAHVEAWLIEKERQQAEAGVKLVYHAEVADIVAKYEGYVEPAPFVTVIQPVLVERRKSLIVS